MTGLHWVRMDAGMYSHDKVLALVADRSPKRYQAIASVTFAIGWSAEHATDGFVPGYVLPVIHATKATAALLVKYGFWEVEDGGWRIRNFGERQELAIVTAMKREANRLGARKTNCRRAGHPEGCTCWQPKPDSD